MPADPAPRTDNGVTSNLPDPELASADAPPDSKDADPQRDNLTLAEPEADQEPTSTGLSDSQADAVSASDAASGSDAGSAKPQIVLCPYCGQTQVRSHKCNACGGLFEPLSRRATQIAMGPWYLRDKHQPFRPGFSYPVLRQMIQNGRVSATTVLRGPTTRQFWSIARNVPGVAHLLGYCHQCHRRVETDPSPANCPHCEARFKSVRQRNELGLQFPTRRAAESAQRALNRILGLAPTKDANENQDPDAEKASHRSSRGEDGKRRKSRSSSRTPTESPDLSEAHADADQQELAAAAAAARDAGTASTAAATVFDTVPDAAAPPPPDLSSDLVDEMLAELPPAAALVASRKKKAEKAKKQPPSPATPPAPRTSVGQPTAALPPRSSVNWTVWLLVFLNVLVAAAVIAYIVMGQA